MQNDLENCKSEMQTLPTTKLVARGVFIGTNRVVEDEEIIRDVYKMLYGDDSAIAEQESATRTVWLWAWSCERKRRNDIHYYAASERQP